MAKYRIIALLLALTACAAQEETITWGFISPLTGTATQYGIPALNAVNIAVDEINTGGGIDGKKLSLIIEDGKCDGVAAITAAQKLISVDKVPVIIGGHCSTESMAIIPVTQAAGVFQLAGDTSTPAYTGKGKYALRTTSSASSYAGGQAEVAIQKGYKTVAILHEQRDYPTGVADAFSKRFTELGGQIILRETFAPASTDFRTQLAKLVNSNSDAILVSQQGPDTAALIFKQIKELGITMPLMGDVIGISEGTWAKSDGALTEEFWAVTPHTDKDENEITQAFVAEYLKRHGELPTLDLSLVAENYDGVKILAEAVAACGNDNDCIRTYFLNVKNRKLAVGMLSYDEHGDPIYELAEVRIVNGKAVFTPVQKV